MKLTYIALIAAALVAGGCNKYLDVKPKGKLIPSEVADFDHLLDNTNIVQWSFLDNNTGCSLAYLTDNTELSEGLGKVSYLANNHPNIDRYYAYIFRQPYKNPAVSDYYWDWGTYRSAAYFNNVIDGVNSVRTPANDLYARQVIAQALVGRAWNYLNTTLVYGPVYRPGGDNSAKTIPYVTSSDTGEPVPGLSTQEEVFKRLLQDLHAALADIPVTTNYPSRPNKTATQAILAHYHLFTRNYDSVAYYANLAWTAGGGASKVLYDYNLFSWKEPANIVNSAINATDANFSLPVNKEMAFYRNADPGTGRSSSSYPSTELLDLFDKTNDLRYQYFFLSAPGYKTTYNNVTYDDGDRIQYYRGAKGLLTSGLTFPEILLLRAEGYARTNRLNEALADLNTLRRYRYKTGTPQLAEGAYTQDQVIGLVLDERRRELPIGHIKRFLDLKRLALDAGKPWAKTSITHKLGETTYQADINSNAFILPIANPVLRYNPGWGVPLDTRPY
ncbi:RagB/SusD family nutrient uptake outer membrane protein [Chitinophaga horti]|uniref:RagB/SusD family nutrient uptake outer membrane protein n=1 Tax=Chitinophaga horti TaxID=2920382 RepID=A0ABY6IZV0_9BACT|nr:RagB/SusD family nutrient uptake outer membrane protein [Chitinophaga horti]UYQ91927.1 RagB/SusD family nutrient uptake outer membrane protein [Chitinophaga horti]